MTIRKGRRTFLTSMGAGVLGGLLVGRTTQAAPFLSESNYGLTYAKAARTNAWLEIDTVTFEKNLTELRKFVSPGVQMCLVVKGDAYGNGLALLTPSIIRAGINCLGITSNEEARILRAMNYAGRIVRLRTATLGEVQDGFEYRIEELVGGLDYARRLSELSQRQKRRLLYHLALNSAGMSRNGLELRHQYGKQESLELLKLPGIEPVGLLSHFPVNELAELAAGLAQFREEAAWLVQAGKLNRRRVSLHIANSFATLHEPESHLDLIRPGRAVYGYGGEDFPQFKHLMTMKSRVATVNHYPKGATVSYGRTYTLTRESWLANIPLGASDGFRPVFSFERLTKEDSPRVFFSIGGHRAPVVGRVTMNTVMVDVTDFKDRVNIDDEVVIFGPDMPEVNTQEYLLRIGKTNPPDLITMIGNSLPKVPKP